MSSAAAIKCNLSVEHDTSLSSGRAGKTTKQSDDQDSIKPCKPKRPLSAYNLFFKHERGNILAKTPVRSKGKPRQSHGKIGFAPLARIVANKWNNLDDASLDYFYDLAAKEKAKYIKEKTKYIKEKAKWKKACMTKNGEKETSENNWQVASVEQTLLEGKTTDLEIGKQLNSIQVNYRGDSFSQYRSNKAENDFAIETNNTVQETNETPCIDFVSRTDFLNYSKRINKNFVPPYETSSRSSTNEKNVPRENLAQNNPFSLLSLSKDIILHNSLGNDEVNPSVMGSILLQERKAPDISELAAKLDDDCMDLLCS